MTRKWIPVANPNSHREMLGQMDLQAVEVAFSGVAWFVAVMWLNFVGRPQLGLTVVIVTGMLVMFLTSLLLAISMVIDDSRWRLARVESGSVSHCCG